MRLENDGKEPRHSERVPDEVLRVKKRIFAEIDTALKKGGKTLKDLFARVDVDHSNEIDLAEFRAMFQKMNLNLTEAEAQRIFNSIDFDWSGKITYPEFVADFKKTVETDIATLISQEKDRAEAERQGGVTLKTGKAAEVDMRATSQTLSGGMGRQSPEMQMQTKIAILEAREKQLGRKLETALSVLHHA